LIEFIILYAHYNFSEPLFFTSVSFWTHLLNEQFAIGFTHYPGHFILLPYYFSFAKLFAGILFEGALLGGAAVIFYNYLYEPSEKTPRKPFDLFSSWFQLSAAWAILNGILTAAHLFLPKLLSPLLYQSPRRQMVFDYGVLPFIDILVIGLLFFAIPWIAIYRVNLLSGIKHSLKIFISRPIFCFLLSFTILIVPMVLAQILNHPNLIVNKFKPEMIYWLLFGGLIVDLFVNFFWMGTAANYLSENE